MAWRSAVSSTSGTMGAMAYRIVGRGSGFRVQALGLGFLIKISSRQLGAHASQEPMVIAAYVNSIW